jgi:transcriptional regulator with XRE-family HTH domain
MSLAIRLKNAREKSGYSQNEVAESLNISRQAVSKWENGWTCPDIDNLILLSKLYKVSTDELLMEDSEVMESNLIDQNISSEKVKENYEPYENFLLIIISVIGCMFPGIGLLVSIAIIIYCKTKKKHLNKIHIVIIIMCIIINVINAWSWLNSIWFHSGRATIEKVALYIR